MAWPIIIKKDVLYVFFCSIETSEISNGKQMKTAVGVYPLCIYTWHRCAPSTEGGTLCAIIYIPVWRRLLLLLIFDMKGFSRAATGKDGAKGNQIPTPSFYNSNPVSNNLLY